jgi:hypothetical protein
LACTCGRRDDPSTDNAGQRNSTGGTSALIR